MSDQITIKRKTIFGVIGFIFIGLFIAFAVRNFMIDDEAVTGDLVRGGPTGSNTVTNENGIQIVNLGVANYNYDPSVITVEAGKPVRIVGNMNQLQGCLRAFSIPQLGLSKIFANGNNMLEFTPKQKGSFGFTCSMGMGTGTLIVQ